MEPDIPQEQPDSYHTTSGNQRPGSSKKRKRTDDDLTTDILTSVRDRFKEPPSQLDCCDLLGKTVTVKMRAIKDKRMHAIFEKRINDILFEAEMCVLDSTSNPQNYTSTPSPQYTPTPTPSPQYTQTPITIPQYTPTPIPSSHTQQSLGLTPTSAHDTAGRLFSNYTIDMDNITYNEWK